MKLKKNEDQSVDTSFLLRMGNKITMEGVTETKVRAKMEGRPSRDCPILREFTTGQERRNKPESSAAKLYCLLRSKRGRAQQREAERKRERDAEREAEREAERGAERERSREQRKR